jgi:error-prone DNA polymerase
LHRKDPGTPKGIIFISLQDETNIANVIVMPDLYDRERLLATRTKFLLIEDILQSLDDVVRVKATRLMALASSVSAIAVLVAAAAVSPATPRNLLK